MKCEVVSIDRIRYGDALELQRKAMDRLRRGMGRETFLLLEHYPVITLGRNADGSALLASENMLKEKRVELFATDRGGDATFHGPGQLVGYPIILLEESRRDISRYVHDLEEVLIRTLAGFSISSGRHGKNRGVWIGERKIASIGVRISRWITSHGFALNVSTDLSYFSLIHPCGLIGCKMTSMQNELGKAPQMKTVKEKIIENFSGIFQREIVHKEYGAKELVEHAY